MRNLLLVSAVLLAACSAPQVTLEDLVPVVFEKGLVLEVPCPRHGMHPTELVSTRVIRLYKLVDDMGQGVEGTEADILSLIDMIAFNRAIDEAMENVVSPVPVPLTPVGPLPEDE